MASADLEALEALFRSTGGENWQHNVNWVTDAKPSTWDGVKVDGDGRVVELRVRRNNLQGPIPETLGSVTNLTKLYLCHNKLTGPIPEALGSLVNVTVLSFTNNQLTGPIPGVLGTLTDLTELDLLGNKLDGPIPEALGSLTNLTYLDLGGNKLTGPIPDALGSLTNLTYLDLSGNKLTGLIPEALESFTKLSDLRLGGNQLTGPIPDALGSLTSLSFLHLGGSQLTGPIPEALGSLTNLTELNLSNNKLTGTVPLSVWKLPRAKHVDLTGNLLTHFTDPEDTTTSTHVVLECMEQLERLRADNKCGFEGLLTAGNPWEFPPAAVVANGVESIRKYYDTWEQCGFNLVEVHALKVVVVGAYGAGKTSLARSIKMGRGDRTPEGDEIRRSTVGVDLHSHTLSNGTECKIYDVAGQITYYGLHQVFLTERAVYVVVWDATKFEGLSGKALDEAIGHNILEWVSLLHMRTPLCTVILVASHVDMLHGAPERNEQLLETVERRFLELHMRWKSLRHRQNSNIDERMTILPGILPVGCKLATESSSSTAGDGLQAVDDALSNHTVVISRVPPSWIAARHILEQVGNAHDSAAGDATDVGGWRRPWELRSVIHAKFKSFVEEGRANVPQGEGQQHRASWLSRVHEDGIRHSMDGAIELRAFSGTVISHDVFVVLDVMWLAGVLKPILDHRGVTKNEMGDQVFADRELGTSTLIGWATDLVDRGVLRNGFACFLWSLQDEFTKDVSDAPGMEPTMFTEVLDSIGVTIPLPVDEDAESTVPPTESMELQEDAETRKNLSSARKAAFCPRDSGCGGDGSVTAVFEFDYAGAPHGLPERVMALSHKIGELSSRARWRLGGLFLLHNPGFTGASSMILEYDKTSKRLCIEALGQGTVHVRAVQFVISAVYHVARFFPGAGWTGWMGCGMSHSGERMYLLATSNEKENQSPGSQIIPPTRDSRRDEWRKQRNLCGMLGIDARGPCTLDPDVFGEVLDVTLPYKISDVIMENFARSKARSVEPDSLTTSPTLVDFTELAHKIDRVERKVDKVEGGLHKMDTGIQGIAKGMQESLLRLEKLQASNYRYPHLVTVQQVQGEGTRSVRSRLRGMFAKEMTLHFLCSFDMTKVPCGYGGNGYRLRKTRGWVKKISPALQVTLVTVNVALRAVAGVDAPGLINFLQELKTGLVEELVDRTLDEDELDRVLSGDEVAGVDMQRKTRASYEAITDFMAKEEAERRKKGRDGDDYMDFRDSMEPVHDEKGGLVWMGTENAQKWKDSHPIAAPSSAGGAGSGVKQLEELKRAEGDQTDDDIRLAARGAVGKYLKGESRVEKLATQLQDEATAREELRKENELLRSTLDSIKVELREAKKSQPNVRPGAQSRDSIDHNILVGMDQAGCVSLCGLPTHEALEKLYAAINQEEVADNLVWYGTEERPSTDAPRAATFRRLNGLFFCLMVLRTGLPVVAVANLFGVTDTTGGRAFTTWVHFLSGALRPFVRLPDVHEIVDPDTGKSTAPRNFINQGFGRVTVVLDATELETVRVWQTDLAYYMFSPYKHRPTGKALVGVTARGAICYMSELYGGRLSDTELVQKAGVIDELSAKGFGGHQGFTVMADKGFNGIGVQLLEAGMSMVVPPYARRGEEQFLQDDAAYTQEVANVRIHVERAIGALKEWKICANKFSSTRMDTVSKAFGVCAALVNMLNEPFVSTKP
eukprot:g15981.t1